MTPDRDLFEPITYENIHELEPGEWIWDDKQTARREHRMTLDPKSIVEPMGFRQIHILDFEMSKPFMLSRFDGFHTGYEWVFFEPGRFYKFKKKKGRGKKK